MATRIARSSVTYWRACSAVRMSGRLTISTSGTPARLKSISECVAAVDPPAGAADVRRLAGVLLEVGPLDADARAVGQVEPAVDVERLVVLADLVRLRHVGIEVVLAVERARLDRAVEGQPDAHRQLDGLPVEHRQRARQAERHRVDVGVRLVAEAVRRTPRTASSPSPARRAPRARRRARSRCGRSSVASSSAVIVVGAPSPVLELGGDPEHHRLAERRREHLHADRQAVGAGAERHAHRRVPGEVASGSCRCRTGTSPAGRRSWRRTGRRPSATSA